MDKRILIVEDDPGALELIVYTLERKGYQVIPARDGLEGFKKAQHDHPDLIILDIMLPGLDGYEICRRLRRIPETAILPILMMSAKARQEDKDVGLKKGADDYLAKPATPAEVVAKVETLLSSTAQIIYATSEQRPVQSGVPRIEHPEAERDTQV